MQYAPLLIAAVFATGLVFGCQQAPAPPAVAPSGRPHRTLSHALALKAEGDALTAKADHRAAAEVYRRAAALDPDDMSIRFALGTAQSFLDQKREAVEAFRGVVARADPASVEYREAKRWLAAVGAPCHSRRGPRPGPPRRRRRQPRPRPRRRSWSVDASWGGWNGRAPTRRSRSVRGEMWIYGAEALTESVKQQRPISLGGKYSFYDIPPGQYRITATLFVAPKDVMVWDQKVNVEDGRPTELVLTPATALVPPDKFPPPPAS